MEFWTVNCFLERWWHGNDNDIKQNRLIWIQLHLLNQFNTQTERTAFGKCALLMPSSKLSKAYNTSFIMSMDMQSRIFSFCHCISKL